jgi:hypothetical protein
VYFNAAIPFRTRAAWEDAWGRFCDSAACIVTEWNAASGANKAVGCAGDAPRLADRLMDYLREKRIGLLGWAFDYPNTVMVGDSLTIPTNYDNFSGCAGGPTNVFGGGTAMIGYFRWVQGQAR